MEGKGEKFQAGKKGKGKMKKKGQSSRQGKREKDKRQKTREGTLQASHFSLFTFFLLADF